MIEDILPVLTEREDEKAWHNTVGSLKIIQQNRHGHL
jgi:hypothetical protein